MIGRRNSLSQKVTEQNPITYTVHCYAHRLALSCTDTVKQLQHIQDCERGLVQTWRYFSVSPLKRAKLKEVQAADVESPDRPRRKLVKACRTRWLSHGEAVIALSAPEHGVEHTELSSVCSTLHYFTIEKKDCTAIGILQLICTKRFLISLYLLNAALEQWFLTYGSQPKFGSRNHWNGSPRISEFQNLFQKNFHLLHAKCVLTPSVSVIFFVS